MSSTATGADGEAAAAEEGATGPHPYFRAIEDLFIDLRGAPLQLSPDDWQVAKKWYEEGIPLALVDQTLREIFERRAAKEGQDGKRKIVTLRYCKRVVERAWRRHQELTASASYTPEPPLDVPARLARLAAALPAELNELGPRIVALEGGPETVEDQLAELDRELLTTARERLTDAQRAALDQHLANSLATLARRLPQSELARARDQLAEQLLRDELDLPVLSLFAVRDDVEVGDAESAGT